MNLENKIKNFQDRFNPLSFYAMLREIVDNKEEAKRYFKRKLTPSFLVENN